MKYVIFKRKLMFIPVIVPEHYTHAEVKIEGYEPVSGGFCNIGTSGFVEVDLNSESKSLGLKPGIRDAVLLTALLYSATASFYLDYEELYLTEVKYEDRI